MEWRTTGNVAEFLAAAGDYLRRDRARNTVILTVTEEGRAVVQRVRRRKDAWLARQLTELTAEERATLRAAVPILEKLSQS